MNFPFENSVDEYHISKNDLLGILRKLFPNVSDKQFRVKVFVPRAICVAYSINTDRISK